MKMPRTLLGAALVALCLFESAAALGSHDSVLMRDISALTFQAGKMTRGRRTSPVPQLTCTGGPCRGNEPNVVQCTNVGFDGSEVQWRCEADLNNAVRFGEITVGCEGYSDKYDPRVLLGSCGLEYSLAYTGASSTSGVYRSTSQPSNSSTSSSFLGNLLTFLIIGVVFYGIYSAFFSGPAVTRGGVYDHNAPPPPYTPGGIPTTPYGYPTSGATACPPGVDPNAYYASQARPAGMFSGWWGGAATGGLLGYLWGRRNTGYGSTYGPSYYGGGRSSFGSYSSSSTHGSSSSGSRTAAGYGGTRNR